MKLKTYILSLILVCGILMMSGCVGGDNTPDAELEDDASANESVVSDYDMLIDEEAVLNEEDSAALEQYLAELDTMLDELENGSEFAEEDM
jgi:hypothetical protein